MFDAEAHCKNAPQVSCEPASVKILQHVNTEQLSGYKCEVRAHRKLYYCGMFSYSKPILSAERETSVVISAPSCSDMAHNKIFIMPQGRKSESIVVPGRTYIMEFPASVLMELMGDSRSPEVIVSAPRKSAQSVRYKKGSSSDDENVEIPLIRI